MRDLNQTSTSKLQRSDLTVEWFTSNSFRFPLQKWKTGDRKSVMSSVRYLYHVAPAAGGYLGNSMFMYASQFGIASRNNLAAVLSSDSPLRTIFQNISAATSQGPPRGRFFNELSPFGYDARFQSLPTMTDIQIHGYLQSWRYFEPFVGRQLRTTEFRFRDSVRESTDELLRSIIPSRKPLARRINDSRDPLPVSPGTPHENSAIFVGVHIRRADLLSEHNVKAGFVVADRPYLLRAMRYMQRQFTPDRQIIYVVCSDDLKWAKTNFLLPSRNRRGGGRTSAFFSEGRTSEQDLALLSACNHTIMTVGTFGWWAAYLAGGTVVYYGTEPAPDTRIGTIFRKIDFFPPHWTAL